LRDCLKLFPDDYLFVCMKGQSTFPIQRQVAASLRAVLRAGGVLVVGIHERVPEGVAGFVASSRCLYIANLDHNLGASHGDRRPDEPQRRHL